MPESFHRTNINLYTSDVEYLQRKYDRGWTEIVREIVHQEIKNRKSGIKVFKNINSTIDLEALIKEQSNEGG